MFKKISQFFDRRGTVLGGFLGILLGAVIFLGMWLFALGGPVLLDRVAPIYTFIPEKLGIIRFLSEEDISTFEVLTPYEGILEIDEAGTYALFSDIPESEVASIAVWYEPTDELVISGSRWYALQEKKVDIPGEFSVAFEAENAGVYRIFVHELPGGSRTITIVPDFTSQNQSVFLLACLVQNAAIVGILILVYRRKNQEKLEEEKEAKQEKKDRLGRWLEEEKKEGEEG
ncbi:MAG: hypothetical protein OEV06_00780 [Anaerolineae bacterium]|nr:hypothetical protein [Anaerolineae bacterium]